MRPFNKWHLAMFSKLAGIAEITLHTIQGPLPGHPISGDGRMTREQLLSNASVISTIILTEQLALVHVPFRSLRRLAQEAPPIPSQFTKIRQPLDLWMSFGRHFRKNDVKWFHCITFIVETYVSVHDDKNHSEPMNC